MKWHWEQPGWDASAVQRKVEEMVERGQRKWPVWRWPTPGPYNGCSGEVRIEGWQRVWLAVKTGLIPAPTVCSVCGSKLRVQYHNEDYTRPLEAKPICANDHRTLHQRFRSPQPWLALVEAHAYDGCWFAGITMKLVSPPIEVAKERAIPISFRTIAERRRTRSGAV